MGLLPMGVYWGLRRLADDGGRFMLIDLTDARAEVLVDLIEGLGPFATGVVLGQDQLDAWRRYGSPHVGRIDRVGDARALTLAKRRAADAVLAPAALGDLAHEAEIARLGEDDAADLGLGARAAGLWVEPAGAPMEHLAAGAVGYLATGAFWQDADLAERERRRRFIADELVPRLQVLNVAALDARDPNWIDRNARETTS